MTKILVVECERSARRAFKRDLEREGYLVVTARSGGEGLRLVERASPDLVILETEVPDMDGLEAVNRLIDRHPRIPVLAVTGVARLGDPRLGSLADACVPRSADTRQLRSKVRELLNPHAT